MPLWRLALTSPTCSGTPVSEKSVQSRMPKFGSTTWPFESIVPAIGPESQSSQPDGPKPVANFEPGRRVHRGVGVALQRERAVGADVHGKRQADAADVEEREGPRDVELGDRAGRRRGVRT